MPDKAFKLSRIKVMWGEYEDATGWRVLRGGKWRLYTKKPDTTEGATRAEMVRIKDYMSFPKYLEVFDK